MFNLRCSSCSLVFLWLTFGYEVLELDQSSLGKSCIRTGQTKNTLFNKCQDVYFFLCKIHPYIILSLSVKLRSIHLPRSINLRTIKTDSTQTPNRHKLMHRLSCDLALCHGFCWKFSQKLCYSLEGVWVNWANSTKLQWDIQSFDLLKY